MTNLPILLFNNILKIEKLKRKVETHEDAMYAGAIGAAVFAEKMK